MTRFIGFVLGADGRSDVLDPTDQQLRRVLASLRSQGPVSFASLTDPVGNYVQAAGGQASCMIEKKLASGNRMFRAFQEEASAVFADGTVLAFNGGNIALRADEWFKAADVLALFLAFAGGGAEPPIVRWREITTTLDPAPSSTREISG